MNIAENCSHECTLILYGINLLYHKKSSNCPPMYSVISVKPVTDVKPNLALRWPLAAECVH